MKQTLHIFAKDVRLYWIEIAASLTALVLFVWLYPSTWEDSVNTFRVWRRVPELTTVLIPITWLVMITRVVHGESLVGDRQFWVTRPYRWPQLFAAKILFLLTFLYIPFFMAQCVLLREAGMHPLHYLPGLLFNLLLMTGIMVLPIWCLAAVTSGFPKILLAILFVILFVSGVAYLDSVLPTSKGPDSVADVLTFIGPVSIFLTVLVIQYARRWTMLSRVLLCMVAVLIALVGLFGPEDMLLASTYPLRNDVQDLQLALRLPAGDSHSTNDEPPEGREVSIELPVEISGLAPMTATRVDRVRVAISTVGGEHWSSHWQEGYATWLPGTAHATVSVVISRAFYERAKDKPVSIELSLALTMLKAGKTTRIALPRGTFELPGGSICRLSDEIRADVSCLFPMRQPKLMAATTRFTKEECSVEPPVSDGDFSLGWIGTLDTEPADFGMTSVWESSVSFQRPSLFDGSDHQYLCPGTIVSFAQYDITSRRQKRIQGEVKNLGSLTPPSLLVSFR